jgi:hypothetical protein
MSRRAAATLLAGWLAVAPAHASPAATVAAHTWTAVETPHLQVLTDGTRSVGLRVALRLEDLRQALSVLLPPLVVDASPVQVIVFREAELAAAYAPTWRGLQDEVAGFYHAGPDRRRVLFVDDLGRTPSVAQHEFLHSLLDVAYPGAPLWLNEGLAEYFSTFTAEEGQARAGTPVRAHLEWLESHDLMPLSRLFAIDPTAPEYHEGDRRGTFYAQSWALTHLLLSGDESEVARLGRVLAAARDGERFDRAFQREFGNESALRARLIAHLERARLPEHEWAMPAPSGAAAPRVRDRVPPAELLASLGLEFLSRPTPQRTDAEAHLKEALALDARQPDALAGMGWLELLRGHATAAHGWFERALEPQPTSVTAVRVLASQLLGDVGPRPVDEDRKAVGTFVRSALDRALAVAPDDPELLSLLARSWVVWFGDDPEPGYAPAARAARALPGRPDVQLDLLALSALTGRDAEAQRIYDQRFRDGSDAELRRQARSALLAADVFRANRSLVQGDASAAETRLVRAQERVADDPELARQAQKYLDEYREQSRLVDETAQENRAIAEYNAGVAAGNAHRYAAAEAAFKRAEAMSSRPELQAKAKRLATRMRQQQDGERAFGLAREGHWDQAIAIFEAMDRASMTAEDRKWLDTNLARLKSRRP